MTSQEFWRAVGEYFLVARERRRLKPSHLQALGGPHYDTIADIERGEIGNLDRVESYAAALGIALVDVFREVLKTDTQELSPEERQLIRTYAGTTVEGRLALVALAAALPQETRASLTEAPDVPSESTSRTPGRPTAARDSKRRP